MAVLCLQARRCILVAASPEILCRVDSSRTITNRPLAGTRKRGRNAAEDARLEQDLLADEKEKAEHIMLVDLGRNDVGKVSEAGSVKVDRLMDIERYSHVMHISSSVSGAHLFGTASLYVQRCHDSEKDMFCVLDSSAMSLSHASVAQALPVRRQMNHALRISAGKLLPDLDAWDALRAALPVGTISGAPKVRAMQIIDELEVNRRGPYGGGYGYVAFGGAMDMALALRTMVVPTDATEALYSADGSTRRRREWRVHLQVRSLQANDVSVGVGC